MKFNFYAKGKNPINTDHPPPPPLLHQICSAPFLNSPETLFLVNLVLQWPSVTLLPCCVFSRLWTSIHFGFLFYHPGRVWWVKDETDLARV